MSDGPVRGRRHRSDAIGWFLALAGLLVACSDSEDPVFEPEGGRLSDANVPDGTGDGPLGRPDAAADDATTDRTAIGPPITDPCAATADLSAVTLQTVMPNVTDPAIREEELPHVYAEPVGAAQDKLFVFLPGTDPGYLMNMQVPGGPEFYTELLRQAAAGGYHVLGLVYVNEVPINITCRNTAPIDRCRERVRLETILGEDLWDDPEVAVTPTESVIHRVRAALTYLGWTQFLEGDEPAWAKIAVAGHSQGGGHAAMIGREFLVDRSILIASTESADWTIRANESFATPADRYFGFSSVHDAVYRRNIAGWRNLEIPGTPTPVTDGRPTNGSHQVTTELRGVDGNDHGTTSLDTSVPLTEEGTPVFRDAWCYLLGR